MFFVDSHCHLNVSRFVPAPDNKSDNQKENKSPFKEVGDSEEFRKKYSVNAIIDRAQKNDVRYMLAIGTELSDVKDIRSIADNNENIFRTIGIHPQEALKHHEKYNKEEISEIIKYECSLDKTVAIGEIGLDYHFEIESVPQQKELFHFQLELAQECKLPVVIHSRDASDDTISILSEHKSVKGVIHCFSGDKDFARKSLNLGYYVSFSGIITFKNAEEIREVAKFVPSDRLLIETDAPFLAPVPFRGKINESAFVKYVAEKISEVREETIENIAVRTSDNFFDLFSKCYLK